MVSKTDSSLIFIREYIGLALKASEKDYRDNYDVWRFGKNNDTQLSNINRCSSLKKVAKKLLNKNSTLKRETINVAVNYIMAYYNQFEWLYNNLHEEYSRKVFVLVMLYRALGNRKIKLPTNTRRYWAMIEAVEKKADKDDSIDLGCMNWSAKKNNLEKYGYPIALYARSPGIVHQFLLQQYRCQVMNEVVGVKEGDIVIDAGGCYGDTALYFAHKTGKTGLVLSFEFMSENLRVFHLNMQNNTELAKRIKLFEKPLWNSSGEKLFITGSGPGTRVNQHFVEEAESVETISIDDLVREQNLQKIDFIKMDIEGSELKALQGAEASIRRFRPQMAISVYHKLEDFFEIPQFVASLNLDYRFAMRHFTIHQEETVLYCF